MSALSFYLVLLLLLQLTEFISSERNGLTIQLIHRDSIESPLYPGNLTHEERITRFLQDYTHSNKLVHVTEEQNKSSINTYHPEQIQPRVRFEKPFYLVLVGIGTFPREPSFISYFLKLDTGSTLIWTQCEGCGSFCFPQTQPLFPYTRSLTYRPLPCNRRGGCGIEGYCAGMYCRYRQQYRGLGSSAGALAYETFTFGSSTPVDERINLIMGCGTEQTPFNYQRGRQNQQVNGILGIGKSSKFSFIGQLGTRAEKRFSYCLQPWSSGQVMNTFLRFGDEAKFGEGQVVSTTSLFYERLPEYHLHLTDITVAGRRLFFPTGSFQLKPDGSGGVVIDVGAPFTSMHRRHYNRVTRVLTPMFSGLQKSVYEDLEHCYLRPRGGYNFEFPSMIFHFGPVDFEVGPEQLFLMLERAFCLAIRVETDKFMPMVIGNHMQANYKIVYDLESMLLSWHSEECV